jgi:hypothetical protein
VELWEGEQLVEQVPVEHALRTLTLGTQGLRLNGRRLVLHGVAEWPRDLAEAQRLRAQHVNLLLVDVTSEDEMLWQQADAFGFLVLGRLSADLQLLDKTPRLQKHPSSFGWLVDEAVCANTSRRKALTSFMHDHSKVRLGVCLDEEVTAPWPDGFRFLAFAEELLPEISSLLPKISIYGGPLRTASPPAEVLGWVRR